MCTVACEDTWFAAVRHIGELFCLQPNPDPFDQLGLPFPDLASTLAHVQNEPAANIWEHYSAPGSREALSAALAKAQAKEARWVAGHTNLAVLGCMPLMCRWLLVMTHAATGRLSCIPNVHRRMPNRGGHIQSLCALRWHHRGWEIDPSELPAEPLPEPDLLHFRLSHFDSLLLEGACLGAALWEAGHELVHRYSYPLRSRRRPASQAGAGEAV